MGEFTTSINVRPSFDHRFDPEKWQRGCGSMHLEFTLGGPLGFITASVNTGWMANPLTGRPIGYSQGWSGPWTGAQRAMGKVGPDIISRAWERPLAGPIACHAEKPPEGKEWFQSAKGCTFFESGICWGDQGYLVGDEFLLRLATGGSEAGFEFLGEIHDDWLAAEVVA
jgi:hypothetical protein